MIKVFLSQPMKGKSNEQIKEELPQTGAPVNAASMGMLGLTSLLGGLFLKKKR